MPRAPEEPVRPRVLPVDAERPGTQRREEQGQVEPEQQLDQHGQAPAHEPHGGAHPQHGHEDLPARLEERRGVLAGLRRVGAGHPVLHRFRIGLEVFEP